MAAGPHNLDMVFETYEAFRTVYTMVFRRMMSYTPGQVGSGIYAAQMAELSEACPEWAEQAEAEA